MYFVQLLDVANVFQLIIYWLYKSCIKGIQILQ